MSARGRSRCGFTLVELLLAVTLAAAVAVSALGALQLFVEADLRSIDSTELAVDVDRALALLCRDVAPATTLALRADRLELEHPDGSAVVWAFPTGGTELHRLAGASLLSLAVPVTTLLLAGETTPQYDSRGHLKDATWRASAVLQGVVALAFDPIRARRDNATIGVSLRVTWRGDAGNVTASTAAVSRVLSEQHALR
jgi:prepilin-type N-terminal cleavage/methylation domain-containing protein